jgi:hypothetical protein
MGSKSYRRITLSVSAALLAAALGAQTRYSVVQQNGVSWFTNAKGQKIWSFGVCVIDQGVPKKDYDLKNPSYGSWQFYPTKQAWAQDAVKTTRSGGFNTVGAWSDYRTLLDSPGNNLYFTPIIHNGSSAGFPWTDMWDPSLVKIADEVTKGLVDSLAHDKRIIGYFSDNELGWWRPAMFEWVWKQKTHFTRSRVIDLLKQRYHSSWKSLTVDFDPGEIHSWDQLEKTGRLCLKTGATGQVTLAAVQHLLGERYYSLCRHLIKQYDPGALYLGDRYISNYYPEVASAAGQYCDVVSTNLNANWADGGYVNYHMAGLSSITHRPLMVTEFYLCSSQNRSGNKNDRSGFPVADSLTQRASGAKNTLMALLSNPDVVGAHWFQYYDEPQNGRGDGENYNFGLVDIHNEPYSELLNAFRSVDLTAVHSKGVNPKEANSAIPRAPKQAQDMTQWDRKGGFIKSDSVLPRGDLYLSWKPEGLEVRVFWSEERFTESYFRSGKVPIADATTINIGIPSSGFKWTRHISPDSSREAGDPLISTSKLDSASWLSAFIPAKDFGRNALKPGDNIRLNMVLRSQTGAYLTKWTVRKKL